ncbi:MAG: 30S ribosome-binding factor RbfA [Planctomycetes bacterium]|nr:30S ribosome-binding factor RbfA [Planctomycetota bacterium]
MKARRKERLNELIKRMVSEKIIRDVKDPRLGFITVTRAELHEDIQAAHIFVTVLEPEKRERTLRVLNQMKGFLQRDLGRNLHIKFTPVLEFFFDKGIDRSFELGALIDHARRLDSEIVHPEEEGEDRDKEEEVEVPDEDEEDEGQDLF